MAQTQPRQNYTSDVEAGINKQINLELYASYVYQSMVSSRHFVMIISCCPDDKMGSNIAKIMTQGFIYITLTQDSSARKYII